MCTTELECLQLLNDNVLDLKAFAYALAVGLVLLSLLYILNKIMTIFVGRVF